MELWNKKDIHAPPLTTFYATKCIINLKLLRKTTKKAFEFYINQQHLHKEAALLSRCIYRMKMKFRNAKDFKMLEKINRIMLSYLELDIANTMKSLLGLIPSKAGPLGVYLPTKNVLDYILIKLQGLAKLMCRLVETTLLGLQYFEDKIRVGHFWNLAVIGLGLISRFHALGKNILLYTCELYNTLRTFTHKLENINHFSWLPAGHKLPKNLEKWVNVPWLETNKSTTEVTKPDLSHVPGISVLMDSDDDLSD